MNIALSLETSNFIKKYVESIRNGNAAIFAGAGLSVPSGAVCWSELLCEAAEEIGLNSSKEHDLISLAQYYTNKHGRPDLNKIMIDEFSKRFSANINHTILAELPIKTYWTTNYDSLIEDSLVAAGKIVDVKYNISQLAQHINGSDAVVYKMHGDKSNIHDIVLTKDDYEMYEYDRHMFIERLHTDLISNTFLFLGFSFDDPNIEMVLSQIRIYMNGSQNKHYCIFRRAKPEFFSSYSEYIYEKDRMDLRSEDLKLRYNIETVWVDNYEDITEILKIIKKKLQYKNVFISGAIEDFSQYEKRIVEDFSYNLAYNLAKRNYKIVTGFGLGIGSATVNGVLDYVYSIPGRHMEKSLIMRPFPQNIYDLDKRKSLWTQYRKDMIRETGIAIFMFGNKLSKDGHTIESDGMYEEFNIALSEKCTIIPLGSTGYVAKQLWNIITTKQESNDLYSEQVFNKLKEINTIPFSESNIDKIVFTMCETIETIQKTTNKKGGQ